MEVSFRGQPLTAFGGWMFQWMQDTLADKDIDQLRIAVAWAKRSGLSRLQGELTDFRSRGGTASVILGIDEGGATKQGLRLAMDLFDSAYAFHVSGQRTFHPKVYFGYGPRSAHLLVGSNNSTAGGIFSNFEASLTCHLDLQQPEDQTLFATVNSWFDTMLLDPDVCKPLTAELLEALIKNPRYKIRDEDQPKKEHEDVGADYDGIVSAPSGDEIFGTGSVAKAGMPPAVQPAAPAASTTPAAPAVPAAPPVTVTRRWSKQMSASDAQHPPTVTSNVIGNLKLSKAGHDIDPATYFRSTMFGSTAWAATPTNRGPKEEAIVTFDVVVAGQNLGSMGLKIDHAAYRIANQKNIPTWLHWGELGSTLRQTDYTGAWVTIDHMSDGSYRLEISSTAPNPIHI